MNLTDFTYLLHKPDAVNERFANSLEQVIEEFPYFHSSRVLRLKHLYNENSYKYNQALKITAAYTTDRSMLFDYITSDDFVAVQKGHYEKKLKELMEMQVVDCELIHVESKLVEQPNSLEDSIKNSIKEASTTHEEKVKLKLDIGKPLEFSKDEKHSFQEWLQLARFKPILRLEIDETSKSEDENKKKKLELIDKFIENNPKIPPVSKSSPPTQIEIPEEEPGFLMTETLARVYLEQKKYSKAIQAYEILILKYPEKSSFFADRIKDIKILQQNN